MKTPRKIYSLILVIFITFIFVGCNTKNTDEQEAQKNAKDWLNLYYTVEESDFEFYEKMNSGFKKEEAQEFISSLNEYEEKFKSFLSDSLFQNLEANRDFTLRIKEPYEQKYYIKVKNIEFEKYQEKNIDNTEKDKEQPMLVYYYNIELVQTSISGDEIKIDEIRKQISLQKNDDIWKVHLFRPVYN
ncbi:hypothetical protein [Oceanirhabdus seepicola]|uniref:Lipoprotein n=1 Tax=Oceanirhabdus seepicola TaxID=2828781 RepID=A0A9J6NYW8_9CLOT|nr:hypothetical protein [Oceanirhabdus seepicola]MCM1989252.1 hypothetical protein [Oceanirhabdus seepicola]